MLQWGLRRGLSVAQQVLYFDTRLSRAESPFLKLHRSCLSLTMRTVT